MMILYCFGYSLLTIDSIKITYPSHALLFKLSSKHLLSICSDNSKIYLIQMFSFLTSDSNESLFMFIISSLVLLKMYLIFNLFLPSLFLIIFSSFMVVRTFHLLNNQLTCYLIFFKLVFICQNLKIFLLFINFR
jgi:hypothetical protein